jgi:hypothetical protein
MESKFKNPFDAAYYRSHFGDFESDGFPEWAAQPGLTILELTFGELTALTVGVLLFFLLSSLSVAAACVLALPLVAAALLNRLLRRRYGPRYLAVFVWRRGVPPPDGWYPFDAVPPGELRKMSHHLGSKAP